MEGAIAFPRNLLSEISIEGKLRLWFASSESLLVQIEMVSVMPLARYNYRKALH